MPFTMKTRNYFVYILTNTANKVLYTGVTNDLERRCHEHKSKLVKGFTQKYNVDKLIYFEEFTNIENAIAREKQIKGLLREKKISLIQDFNCNWQNLCPDGKVIFPE
jgi:putative endonuclease